jgi:imidazolonepropionase-like amidohydrolase
MQRRYQAERQLIDSGVQYVLHSDAGVRETPFGEFWLIPASACFELGLSPLEAIRAVTSTPAALMGLDGEVGTLAPGHRADLLVVDGNPAERIEDLAGVRHVLLDGRLLSVPAATRAPYNRER